MRGHVLAVTLRFDVLVLGSFFVEQKKHSKQDQKKKKIKYDF